MTEAQEFQRRMLAAARREGMPSGSRAAALEAQLVTRCEGDAEPAWRSTGADGHAPSSWRAWAVGAALAVAALVLLTLGVRVIGQRIDAADDADAAVFEAAPAIHDGTAESRAHRVPRPAARTPVVPPPAPAITPELPAVRVVPTPPQTNGTTRAPSPRRRSVAGADSSSVPVTDVAGEARALREAQRALTAGNLAAAADALARYRQQFPQGALEPEAQGLRAIVACKRGRSNAARLAKAFVDSHPRSPLVTRVQQACKKAAPAATDSPR